MEANLLYFQSAVREMSKRSEAILHHGFLCPDFGVGRPSVAWDTSVAMAWVEDGNVIIMRGNTAGQIIWPHEEFRAVFQPRFMRTYTHDELGKNKRSYGTDGPWEDVLLDHVMIRGVMTRKKIIGEQKRQQATLRSLLLRKKMDRKANVR